jgi:chromosomal replication initiation ATPase DnaA
LVAGKLFGHNIKNMCREIRHDIQISFRIQDKEPQVPQETSSISQKQKNTLHVQDRGIISMTLNKQNTFENFVIESGNQMAHAACTAVVNTLGRACNPLFLYGDTGLEKIHLMQTVAHSVLNKFKRSILFIHPLKFLQTNLFTNCKKITQAHLGKNIALLMFY